MARFAHQSAIVQTLSSWKNRPALGRSNASDGGSCTSKGPRLRPSPALSSRKRRSGALARLSFRSCVIVRGILTQNRKSSGVEAAHFA